MCIIDGRNVRRYIRYIINEGSIVFHKYNGYLWMVKSEGG